MSIAEMDHAAMVYRFHTGTTSVLLRCHERLGVLLIRSGREDDRHVLRPPPILNTLFRVASCICMWRRLIPCTLRGIACAGIRNRNSQQHMRCRLFYGSQKVACPTCGDDVRRLL